MTSYLVDPLSGYGNVVEERSGFTGSLVARYDYGADLARMDRISVGAARYYLHDGLGRVVGLTDGAGAITDRWGYDAYGNPTHLEGSTLNPFLFNGQQWDGEEGLYFNRARYYAPGQGRFLTHDPLMGSSGDPQSLHRYLYANADPVNFTDPTGMFSLSEELTVADLAPMVRTSVGRVTGSVVGSLMGATYAFGKASILKASYEDTILFSLEAALNGMVVGGNMGGGLALFGPCSVVTQAIVATGTALDLIGTSAAVGEDLGNYAATGDSKYLTAATWDGAWGALALVGLRNVGCFTEDAQVGFFSGSSPMEHSGSIKELVSAWQSGADVSVRARDEVTGKEEIRKVTNAWERTVTDVVTVEFADAATGQVGEVLTGTLDHPFMTPKGWVGMGSLGIGTEILTRAGPRLVVKSVRRQHYSQGINVYNFTVDGKHTYFVGSAFGGAWVHNEDTDCFEHWLRSNERIRRETNRIDGDQSNHLFQDKAFESWIPRDEAPTVWLNGQASSTVRTNIGSLRCGLPE